MNVRQKIKGLTHFLSEQEALQDVVCTTNMEDFHVIFAGSKSLNPAELSGSKTYKSLIAAVRKVMIM